MKKNSILITRTFLLMMIMVIIAACSRNPITGKKEAFVMSEAKEQKLGDQSDPSIVASFGLYPDQKLQKFINTKGQQMARISHRSHLKFNFKILDSPVVNAFALPGGYVYFTRGIMAHFNNEAEFAGVLGHEIGHVSGRHSAKQQRNQIFAQVGLIAGVVLSKKFRNYAESASQGLGLLMLKNSRGFESQSDEMGVEYSTKIGYDANYMAGFFKTLNRLSGGSGQRIPTFMSTHPDPLDRYRKVGALAKKEQAKYPNKKFKVNRDQYLRMLEGLVYGEDPRQGYVENNVFYHPELKFQFPVPTGWKTANSPQQFQMASKDGKGMMIFTLAPEKTLNEAANNFVTKNKLKKVEENSLTINGFPAKAIVTEQIEQKQDQQGKTHNVATLKIVSYFIKDGSTIYLFHGLSEPSNFISYKNLFRNTMEGFARLTDPSKINKKPERIHIMTVSKNMNLSQAFREAKIDSKRFEEMAIVNGMELSDKLTRGQLIKVLKK